MIFYLGTHRINHCQHFARVFVSVNILRNRKADFLANNWIMDSGAFTELSRFGEYRWPVEEYAGHIDRWKDCGNLELAVSQDYMCEPFILAKTGLTIRQHQKLTIERYEALVSLTDVAIMPVLQGYHVQDYINHLGMYADRLEYGAYIGIGSVCKRNGNPQEIIRILEAIKGERPDLKLHGFGLKLTSLANLYLISLLESADSMAWSYAARRQGRDPNSLDEATKFLTRLSSIQGQKPAQLRLVI